MTMVNGCTLASATDMTNMSTVNLTWTDSHQQCIVVSAGTTVIWNGDFASHPLDGGVTGITDAASPITLASPVAMQTSVTFNNVGDFPYYCTVHLASMQGVIYVQ
jgi:plastocyanin